MSWYIGFYSSGKTRVFQTSKVVTKKSFPFYDKVMGPFDSEEEAREEASRHRPRISVRDTYKSEEGEARRALGAFREEEKWRKRKGNPGSDWKVWITFPRESAAQDEMMYLRSKGKDSRVIFNPNSRKWEVWVSSVRENPGAKWHRERADRLRVLSLKLPTGYSSSSEKRRGILQLADEHESDAVMSEHLGVNPFRSKAQHRKFRALEERGELRPGTSRRWARETRGGIRGLPEKVENPRRDIDRFRPFHGGTPTYCTCGHLKEVHRYSPTRSPSRQRTKCKFCSCKTFRSETLRRLRVALRDTDIGKNPPGHKIYDNILAIEARKGKDSNFPSENFRHDFKGGATVEGMPDGSLRIKSKRGKRLWKKFDY